MLAEAGRVLTSKSVQAATFSSLNDTPHSQIQGRLVGSCGESWTYPGLVPGTATPWILRASDHSFSMVKNKPYSSYTERQNKPEPAP